MLRGCSSSAQHRRADRHSVLDLDTCEDGVRSVYVGGARDLREQHPGQVIAHHGIEVTQDHSRGDRLHPHEVARRAWSGRSRLEELPDDLARAHPRLFGARRPRLLEIEEQRIGTRPERSTETRVDMS